MTIYPQYLGEFEIVYENPIIEWVTVITDQKYSFLTPNHHQDKKPIISYAEPEERTLPNNQKYVEPLKVYKTEGEGCPWTALQSLTPLEDHHKIKIIVNTWGKPCNYIYGASISELKPNGVKSETLGKHKLYFNQSFTFKLPDNVTMWRIVGTTTTFKKVDLIGKSNFESLISFQDVINSSNEKNIVYKINNPSGVTNY